MLDIKSGHLLAENGPIRDNSFEHGPLDKMSIYFFHNIILVI